MAMGQQVDPAQIGQCLSVYSGVQTAMQISRAYFPTP